METLELDKIICGDCLDIMKKMPDACVDLIFADPPYWMRTDGVLHRVNGSEYNGCDDGWDKFASLEDYKKFTMEWLKECKRILKKDGSIWVIGGMQCIYTIGSIMLDLGFWFINDVVWFKKNPTPNFKGTRLNNSHETLIWAVKNQKSSYHFNYKTAKELNKDTVSLEEYAKGIRKQMGSVWRISVCQGNERLKDKSGNKLHSTQKPIELLYKIIAINSKVGDVVFDPFGGTMTTATMAKKMGRHYISIDNDENYCKYGKARIENTLPIIGDIEKATFDIKPPRVTFSEMIADGYFFENEKMYYKGQAYYYLTKKGKLIRPNEEEIDIHSAIAKLKNSSSPRLNGWDFWEVSRNGKFVLIDEIRQKYIKEVKANE